MSLVRIQYWLPTTLLGHRKIAQTKEDAMRYVFQITPDDFAFEHQSLEDSAVPEEFWRNHRRFKRLDDAIALFEDWRVDFNHVRVIDGSTGETHYPTW
jgi:hypothetical protein